MKGPKSEIRDVLTYYPTEKEILDCWEKKDLLSLLTYLHNVIAINYWASVTYQQIHPLVDRLIREKKDELHTQRKEKTNA